MMTEHLLLSQTESTWASGDKKARHCGNSVVRANDQGRSPSRKDTDWKEMPQLSPLEVEVATLRGIYWDHPDA